MGSKKKRSLAAQQEELRKLAQAPERPPVDLRKLFTRAGLLLVVVWVLAIGVATYARQKWPYFGAGVLTIAAIALGVWVLQTVRKNEQLAGILKGADTKEGRAAALEKLQSQFKKDDAIAAIAKAQLEMQESPEKALATLEAVDLKKQYAPGVADQVRAMRATIHLQRGDLPEARALVDSLDLGKQQEAKLRVMFATVAAEAWARTGQGKKAVETLELFNPDDPDNAEIRIQMLWARAFAYASVTDSKAIDRTLKKLVETNPQLLARFVGQRKIHPLLERAAKQALARSGAIPRKVVRQKM